MAATELWKPGANPACRHAPATRRNRDPILAVLKRTLPRTGTVLEIASGTGEHAAWFAHHLPDLTWQPSDPDPEMRASITAWAASAGWTNLKAPLTLDTTDPELPKADLAADLVAIVNINMIHIAPWAACVGLMRAAGRLLPDGGILYLYGPFRRFGDHTAPSNAAFDASLRARDPEWGVRDLEDVEACATDNGIAIEDVTAMPANNFSAVFRRRRFPG